MNDKTEQSLADVLRAMATSNSDLYEYERLQLKDAADTIDTLRAQLAEAQKQCKLLLASLEDLVCYDSHEVEYDGRVFEICPSCGKQDHDDHRPACEFLTARAAIDAAKGAR